MSIILFDIFPAMGHYNGSLKLYSKLKTAGYIIIYTSTNKFDEYFREKGIDQYQIEPFIFGKHFKDELKEKGFIRFMIENINEIFSKSRENRIEENIGEYDDMICHLKPSLIVLDEHYASKAIIYSKYNIPIISLQTSLVPDYDPEVPPFTSKYIPRRGYWNHVKIKISWYKIFFKLELKLFFNWFLCLGKHTLFYYKLYAKKYNFPYHENILWKRLLGIRFEHIPSVVISPEVYDFPRSRKKNIYYLGNSLLLNPRNVKLEGRLGSVLEKITSEKSSDRRIKLIYCSLGTITRDFIPDCMRFFARLFFACRDLKGIRLIVSTGEYLNISGLPSTPSNVFVFNRVPQDAVLVHCDFVINHGGLNTIFECIMAERPMIVLPLSKFWDQNGNSARVIYHKIGIRGNLKHIKVKGIERILAELIKNEYTLKRNIRELKAKFKDNSEEVLHLLEGILSTEKNADKI